MCCAIYTYTWFPNSPTYISTPCWHTGFVLVPSPPKKTRYERQTCPTLCVPHTRAQFCDVRVCLPKPAFVCYIYPSVHYCTIYIPKPTARQARPAETLAAVLLSCAANIKNIFFNFWTTEKKKTRKTATANITISSKQRRNTPTFF